METALQAERMSEIGLLCLSRPKPEREEARGAVTGRPSPVGNAIMAMRAVLLEITSMTQELPRQVSVTVSY